MNLFLEGTALRGGLERKPLSELFLWIFPHLIIISKAFQMPGFPAGPFQNGSA